MFCFGNTNKRNCLHGFAHPVKLLCFFTLFFAACGELEQPKTEEFYSETKPPRKQEFRWLGGKMPETFDPAFVSAPPETDIVRAIYDGLTEMDSKSLKAARSIAEEWSSSEDYKTWTFKLRRDVKWSNGETLKAEDFVRSWKRLAELGESVPHHKLLKNIVGAQPQKPKEETQKTDTGEIKKTAEDTVKKESEKAAKKKKEKVSEDRPASIKPFQNNKNRAEKPDAAEADTLKSKKKEEKKKEVEFGALAEDDFTLVVKLNRRDKEFPKLVAHPIFRPVYAADEEFNDSKLKKDVVTSGAFRIETVSEKGVTLKKAKHYWNADKIKLESVTFVPAKDADSALEAYKNGEVDAVTNIEFEPLALKLLTPYVDFKRTTHSALNFYEFNRSKEPFNDRRVRKALAISIEREHLTADKMDGATIPAYKFLPFNEKDDQTDLKKDAEKARELMERAGFPDGKNFPEVKLVINRNNVQQKIAKSIAEMWKKELNIDTEIVVKELEELEESKEKGEFDIVRRGVVLPTADETANMLAIFPPSEIQQMGDNPEDKNTAKSADANAKTADQNETGILMYNNTNTNSLGSGGLEKDESSELIVNIGEETFILTEEEAILEVPAIPLYFPTTYSLVKPYVTGFEINALDAPSLKEVKIDSDWHPKEPKNEL